MTMGAAFLPREYARNACAAFCKTRETWGSFSNMAGGFPLPVGDVVWRSSEALYQALRFPDKPAVQSAIAVATSPMTAKAIAREHDAATRPDWALARIAAMRWVLRVKAFHHPEAFGDLLLSTGARPIVEISMRDDFWGAQPQADGRLVGVNVLGRLLMELRAQLQAEPVPGQVPPPRMPNPRLLGRPIEALQRSRVSAAGCAAQAEAAPRHAP